MSINFHENLVHLIGTTTKQRLSCAKSKLEQALKVLVDSNRSFLRVFIESKEAIELVVEL